MSKLRRLLIGSVVAAMAVGVASANTISFSSSIPQQTSPFTDTFSLANFNTALGTLTGVTVTFNYSTTGEVDIQNTLSTPQAFTNATSSTPVTLNADFSVTGLTATTNAVAGPISGTANPGFNAFPGLTGTGTLTINVPTADFIDFEIPPSGSTDSYSVTTAGGTFGGSSVPGVFFSGNASAGGTATITYTYTVPSTGTPEPATMVLFGSALVGLGCFRKRVRKS